MDPWTNDCILVIKWILGDVWLLFAVSIVVLREALYTQTRSVYLYITSTVAGRTSFLGQEEEQKVSPVCGGVA